MAEYEWTMYQIKVDYAMMHWKQFSYTLLFFSSILRNFESNKPGIPFTQLNQATYSKLEEKVILTCFTKLIAE